MIVRTATTEAPAPLIRRLFAVMGVALVLLLGTASFAPVLHDWLHVDHGHEAHHECAVVLFASGVTLAATGIVIAGPTLSWQELSAPTVAELFLVVPRYLRQPERGPPAG